MSRCSDLDKLVWRSEAADTQRDEDPAPSMRTLRRVLTQLLTDLTVDLIPNTHTQITQARLTLYLFRKLKLMCMCVCVCVYLSAGLRIPLPMMKWSFSRLDVGRSSSMLLPWRLYSPSLRRLVTWNASHSNFSSSALWNYQRGSQLL